MSFPAGNDAITFDITITNPCHTTTIPTLTFSPNTQFTVVDGATATQEFTRPVNGVETSTGVPLVCGSYAFAVYADQSDSALSAAWLTIAEKPGSPGTYVMTADTTVDITLLTTEATKTYNVQVKAYLVDYTYIKTYTAKSVQITAATCVCSALAWDAPAVLTPTVAVASTENPTVTPPVANKGA